jgi:uncharacterized protein (TIGR02594 family)
MKNSAAVLVAVCAATLTVWGTPADASHKSAKRANLERHDHMQSTRRAQRARHIQRAKIRRVRSARVIEPGRTRSQTRMTSAAPLGAADIYLRRDEHVPQSPITSTVVNRRVTERRAGYESQPYPASAIAYAAYGSAGGSHALVTEARRWLGTNPTNRRTLWCGAFLNFVLERSGYRRGRSDLARSFASYGRRVSGPQVGAIAVMARGGGGHVGVVSGFDEKGNPIIISGNHANSVREVVYPRGRIYAYVVPGE